MEIWYNVSLKRKNKNSPEELLDGLSEVYADFGYPEDMEPFIHYMPSSDGYNPLLYSKEENINRLVSLFEEFLQKKKKLFNSSNFNY